MHGIWQKIKAWPRRWMVAVAGIFLGVGLVGAYWVVPQVWPQIWPWLERGVVLVTDEAALEEFVRWLDWLGPLVLIGMNALQIIVAPIPAYAIFAAAGFLYGGLWGGIYGMIGTLLGAAAAMLLTRRFGRPLAARMVGGDRLERWSSMTVSQSMVTWSLLLLAPVGDLPFFLAGLSKVGVARILVLTTITRVPTIFLISATASGATGMAWWQLVLIILAMLIFFGLVLRQQDAILNWVNRRINRRLQATEGVSPVHELGGEGAEWRLNRAANRD
jgi:uncharacterized membrane protein YdjX (TVP38/TMEM64 family)